METERCEYCESNKIFGTRAKQQVIQDALSYLEEAVEDLESWSCYATEYFQTKHDLDGCLKKHKDRIEQLKKEIENGQRN